MGSMLNRWFVWLAGAAGIGSGLLVFLVARTSAFVDDDFLNIGQARSKGLSLELLFHPVTDVHLQPVHRFLTWLLVATGTQVTGSALISAVLFGLSMGMMTFAVREISGSGLVALGVCGFFATSIVVLRVSLWWTEAAGEFSALAMTFAMTLAALRWTKTPTRRLLVLNGVLAIGVVLSFDKYLTVFLPVAAVLIVGMSDERQISVAGLGERLRDCWKLIAVWAAVLGMFLTVALVAVLMRANPFTAGNLPTGPSAWAEFLVKWFDYGVGGALTNSTPGADTPTFIGLIVLFALAALTIRGSRSALLWVAAIVTIVANAVILGIGRLGSAGLILVIDARFQDLTLLTLALIVPAAWRASGSPKPRSLPLVVSLGAVILGLTTIWVANGRNSLNEQRLITRVDLAHSYATTLRTSLTPIAQSKPDLTLLDELTPTELVGYRGAAYTETGSVTRTLAPGVKFTVDNTRGTVFRIASNGKASVVALGNSTPFVLPSSRCLNSKKGSKWNGAGSASLQVILPEALRKTSRSQLLLITVGLADSNARGGIGLGLTGADGRLYRFASQPLATHETGLRAPSPVADPVHVLFWDGASACVTGVSAQRFR